MALLELTGDQELLRSTARSFLESRCPIPRVRELAGEPHGFDPIWWRAAADLGWTSLLVDERLGGGCVSEHGLADLAVLAGEAGRLVAPGPLLPTNVVASALSEQLVGTVPGPEQASMRRSLAALVSGEQTAAWCWAPHGSEVRATPVAGGWTLSGRIRGVEAAAQAGVLLMTADGPDGPTQFLLPVDLPGIRVEPAGGIDAVRRFGTVDLDGVRVTTADVLGVVGGARTSWGRQLLVALVLQSAETVGAIDRVFEFTTAWAFDRYSFGRPLASYQALKHRFADMKMWLEAAHAISEAATRAVAADRPDAGELARVAKLYLAEHAPRLVQDCVQMHGGLGVTWEHDIHLYLRRVTLNRSMYGTPEQCALELADLIGA